MMDGNCEYSVQKNMKERVVDTLRNNFVLYKLRSAG